MKKFNFQFLLALLIFGIWNISSIAQTLVPPENLTYTIADENDVTLFWDAPALGGDSTWLHWDDGVNADGFGFFLSAETWDAAAKWDPAHLSAYDGWYITGMRFYVTSASINLTMKVWTGSNPDLQYSEAVPSFSPNQWTEVSFATPYEVDASTELWAGLELAQQVGTAVMGMDNGPAIAGYGDKIKYQGSWYDNSVWGGFDNNWNIQILVSSTTKAGITEELLGYNVYRDGLQLNTSTVVVPTFVDMNLNNGLYDYHVTALYDEGESDTSNHVDVLINQPVILYSDSMALVDLYNACDGPNWLNNFNWLETPVNEWWGVTTHDRRVTNLFLSNNDVTGDIPASFGNLDSLFTFKVSSNEITSLPDGFHKLTSLTEFWAGSSSLTELPDSFGYLPELQELNLGFNEIDFLPESFGNLANLNWFGMFDGGLDSLPSTFGDLSGLETCFMGSNDLVELPADIGDLASIIILDFDNNQLASLPESFGNMSTLENFTAESNNLTSLPATFGNLESLIVLDLKVNQLDSLPLNFGDLDDLESLALSINNLTTFPESFADLQKLKVLSSDQNQITHLPDNIGDLPSIIIMGLSYNQITTLPESIGNLSTLTELFLVENELEYLPETIGEMDVIRRLALGKNNLETLPTTVGDLNTLLYLDLSENLVSELPESLGDIGLDTVFLFQNQIREIPSSMLDNAYLILWMEDNYLQFGSVEPFVGVVGNYYYAPQDWYGEDTLLLANQGSPIEYTIEVSGDYNQYQWYKDGSILSGQTSNTLIINSLSAADEGIYHLEITNTLAAELTLISHNVEVNISSVGVNENELTEFVIYPNPASEKIVIELNQDVSSAQLSIMNASGQVVKHTEIKNKYVQLQITDLPSGIYLASLVFEDRVIVKKFVKE